MWLLILMGLYFSKMNCKKQDFSIKSNLLTPIIVKYHNCKKIKHRDMYET